MQLAMIGLGRMGGNMTERLMRDGHHVVVFDRSPEAVQKYVGLGAVALGWSFLDGGDRCSPRHSVPSAGILLHPMADPRCGGARRSLSVTCYRAERSEGGLRIAAWRASRPPPRGP